MASLFGHTAAALTVGKLSPYSSKRKLFWLLLCLVSVLPDFDVVAFVFHIPYSSQWGHRGFTHSYLFALVVALLVTTLAFRQIRLFSKDWFVVLASFFAAGASHPQLDALTNGGLGVALYWPFDLGRYFHHYRPIEVSPIGITQFFSAWGLEVLQSEFVFILLPCLFLLSIQYLCKKTLSR
ncbi:MAG: metal-dependent hydrolase [Deltaproteobacteria bacterium]|nr:metal-dependent hydrolase [Deltaproteobacteria bacterium]